MEQKYRHLKVGDVKPERYEYRNIVWLEGEGAGSYVTESDSKLSEYRVPITEPETKEQSVCEMVLCKSMKYIRKDDKSYIGMYDENGYAFSSGNAMLPSDFHEAPIGTIWDNVNGKPVRRPTVEKCAICNKEPTIKVVGLESNCSCNCGNAIGGSLVWWNNQNKLLKSVLEEAGWVRK